MLSFALLNQHAGILLVGDNHTLRALHELLRRVNDDSPLIIDKKGIFLHLAYDVRRAYEVRYEVLRANEEWPDVGTMFGSEELWPTILIQARTLRASLSCLEHCQMDEALVSALEAVLTDALVRDFGNLAPAIYTAWARAPFDEPVWAKLHAIGGLYCSLPGPDRAIRLANYLDALSPWYTDHYNEAVAQGRGEHMVSPRLVELGKDTEWADPRWRRDIWLDFSGPEQFDVSRWVRRR